MSTLIKAGMIITASDTYQADIFIDGGKIQKIGAVLDDPADTVIPADDMYVIPGGIDVHTHLDMPFGGTNSSDNFETGHKAAAFGGTTSHIDFCLQPSGGSFADGLQIWHDKADGKACIDYGFHMAITDLNETALNELPELPAQGVTSIKMFMAYKGVFMVDDETLFRAMQIAGQHGILSMVHAENGDVVDLMVKEAVAAGYTEPHYHAKTRPALVEAEATGRAVHIAGVANAPLYVVHMTCEGALEQLRIGQRQGLDVYGETCTQYFFVTEDDLARPDFEGAKYVCSPPVRTEKDQDALWKAVADGTLAAVSTDHCPFFFEGQKEMGRGDFSKIPNGMPGIEEIRTRTLDEREGACVPGGLALTNGSS
ncbi:MAG: dihydropyrimidinase [Trueperaceae bacterium]|nr:dihydropyrimidinase [Trueperaceae bacterium]